MKHIKILILFCTVLSVRAYADAYIPPTAPQVAITQAAHGTPVEHSMFNNHSWNKTDNTIKRNPHFGSTKATAGTVTATKTNPATFTGRYGEKATGTIKTQTQVGSASTINKAAGAFMAGSIAGNMINSPHAQTAAEELAKGNYGSAAFHAAASADWTGIGSGINGLKEAFQRGASEEIRAAAQAKAQAAAQAAEEAMKDIPAGYNPAHEDAFIGYYNGQQVVIHSGSTMVVGHDSETNSYRFIIFEKNKQIPIKVIPAQPGDHVKVVQVKNDKSLYVKQPTLEDFLLNQQELNQIITDYLAKNLATNEALRTDIVNMLWAAGGNNGGLDPNNTQTQVIGSPTDNTFLSAPYTPVGSNQAQQTEFIVNNNGDVITNIIKRPDLAAHTSQAPTRQQVGENTANHAQSQTQAPKEQATEKSPDVCAMNPNSLMCAEMGSADYEDISLPDNTIDIGVKYVPYFNSTGSCPQDIAMSWMGATFQFSYAPVCKIASLLNPVFQFVGMAYAAAIAFAAVREL